jgi:hypothetical protein
MPWFNINQIAITLSQAATVSPGDVSVNGITGVNYGPVTISGSGTSNLVITLAQGINNPDRVTLSIANRQIVTYTGRLDVLPGDVNDDGAVNTTDGVLILRNTTPAHAYNNIYDMNGDGAVDRTDFNLFRPSIGSVLPGVAHQLAAGGEGPRAGGMLNQAQLGPVVREAIRLWARAGLPAREVVPMRSVSVRVGTIPAGILGEAAVGGSAITLSADAADHGWFVAPASTRALAARVPAGEDDLLTVVLHELGHAVGLGDIDSLGFSNDLMTTSLPTGVRRLPSARDVATVTRTDDARERVTGHSALVDSALEGLERPLQKQCQSVFQLRSQRHGRGADWRSADPNRSGARADLHRPHGSSIQVTPS